MIVAFLALASSVAGTQTELVTAFETICLRDKAPLEHIDANASAVGFRSIPVERATTGNHETKAWQRRQVRLFVLSGQADPRWPLQPICGVAADVGKLGDHRKLLSVVADAAQAPFIEGQSGKTHSSFHLPRADRGIVEVSVNKDRPSHVQVMLLLQMPPSVTPEH